MELNGMKWVAPSSLAYIASTGPTGMAACCCFIDGGGIRAPLSSKKFIISGSP
jgi:hypothetical protein